MEKARIVQVKVGVKTFYYPQIKVRFLFVFRVWQSISIVSQGRVFWSKNLQETFSEADDIIVKYKELYGVELPQSFKEK
jgi:hypothetical protein